MVIVVLSAQPLGSLDKRNQISKEIPPNKNRDSFDGGTLLGGNGF